MQALVDGGAPFDLENLQALCRRCHDTVTHDRPHGFHEWRDRLKAIGNWTGG